MNTKKLSAEERRILKPILIILALIIFFGAPSICISLEILPKSFLAIQLPLLFIECALYGFFSGQIVKADELKWPKYLTIGFFIALGLALLIFGLTELLWGGLLFWGAYFLNNGEKFLKKVPKKEEQKKKTLKPGPAWPVEMKVIKNPDSFE